MNTVSSNQLLNLLLNVGSTPDTMLSADLTTEIPSLEGVNLDGLPDDLLARLTPAVSRDEGFSALMQQQLAVDTDLPAGESPADAASVPAPLDEAQTSLIDEPVVSASPQLLKAHGGDLDADSDDVEDDAAALSPVWAMSLPVETTERPVAVASPSPDQLVRTLPSQAARSGRVSGAEPERSGQVLPPQRQVAAADMADNSVQTAVMATDSLGESVMPLPAADDARGQKIMVGEQTARSSAASISVEKSMSMREGEALSHDDRPDTGGDAESQKDPDSLSATRQPDKDDLLKAHEPLRTVSDAVRSDTVAVKPEHTPNMAASHAAMKPVDGSEIKGMNDLPPELRDLHLSPRANETSWGRELGERVGFLLHNNMKQAEIRLDPPHLGKLEIQLQVQDDKAVVHIHTQTAQTRDLIDASLLRLRDALQDAGYSQVDVNVSQRDQSMAGQDGGDGRGFAGNGGMDGLVDAEPVPPGMNRHEIELTARMQGRIDYFA